MPQPRARHPRHRRHSQHRCHAQAPLSHAQLPELSTLQQLRLADVKLRTPTQPLGQAAAAARRHSHLAPAARLCNSSTQAVCRRRRANIAAEFSEEMQLLGGSIAKANDEDTAGFFAGVWLARHTGTMLPTGDQVAAPGSLANAVSDLAAIFDQHGRNGPWISASGTGNPCHSEAVKSLVQGYSKAAFHQGFAESCAVPLTVEQLRAG